MTRDGKRLKAAGATTAASWSVGTASTLRMRPAAVVLCGYLAATAILLATGGLSSARLLALLAHLAALSAVVICEFRRGAGKAGSATRVFADLHPLVLLPALYAELPLLMEGLPGPVVYHDEVIQRLEASLFGFQPAFELAGRVPVLALSEVVHLAYLLYYAIVYVPPLLLYAAMLQEARSEKGMSRRDASAAFDQAMLALIISVVFCFATFVVWPVQGPRYLGVPEGAPDGPIRSFTLALLQTGSSRGAAFPSSHVAFAVTQTLLMLRFRRAFGVVLVGLTLLLALGAIYGGFHYVVDTLLGAVVGGLAVWAAHRITAHSSARRTGFAVESQ